MRVDSDDESDSEAPSGAHTLVKPVLAFGKSCRVEDPSFEGARAYLQRPENNGKTGQKKEEERTCSLFEHGYGDWRIAAVTYNPHTDSFTKQPGQLVRVDVPKLDLLRCEDISYLRSYRASVVENDVRMINKDTAKTRARSNPGQPIYYETTKGYWSSALSKIAKYVRANGKEGTDSTEPRPTHAPFELVTLPVIESAFVPIGSQKLVTPQGKCKRPRLSSSGGEKPVEGRDPNLYTPPGAVFQQARYAGMCDPLKKYLVGRHLWRYQGDAHWHGIREWSKTTSGRQYLRDCGLDPESFHLDHIHDKNHTPLHHAFNCYFMPGGANSHFKDRCNDEKMAYIGEQAATISGAFLKWYMEAANKLSIDCSRFSVAKNLF